MFRKDVRLHASVVEGFLFPKITDVELNFTEALVFYGEIVPLDVPSRI